MLLDIGCGSGLSGEILDEEGHIWVGMDISPSMLEVALDREVEGDLFLHDIGQGLGFRAGSFDGAIRCAFSRRPVAPFSISCMTANLPYRKVSPSSNGSATLKHPHLHPPLPSDYSGSSQRYTPH